MLPLTMTGPPESPLTAGFVLKTSPAGRTRVARDRDIAIGIVPNHRPGRACILRARPPNPNVTAGVPIRGAAPSTIRGKVSADNFRKGRTVTMAISVPGTALTCLMVRIAPWAFTVAPVGCSRKKCAHVSTVSGSSSVPEQ